MATLSGSSSGGAPGGSGRGWDEDEEKKKRKRESSRVSCGFNIVDERFMLLFTIGSLILYCMRPGAGDTERRMAVNIVERFNLELPPGGVFDLGSQTPENIGAMSMGMQGTFLR